MIENEINSKSYITRKALDSLGLGKYYLLEEKPYIKIYHLDNYNKARYFYKMSELLIAPVFRIALAVNWERISFDPSMEPSYKITRDLIEKLLAPYENETSRWIYSLNLRSVGQLVKVINDFNHFDEWLNQFLNILNKADQTIIPESLAGIIAYLKRAYSMTSNLTNSSTERTQDSIVIKFAENSNKLLTQMANQFFNDLDDAVNKTNDFGEELARKANDFKRLLDYHANLERSELISISLKSTIKPSSDEELSITLLKNQKTSSLLYDKVKISDLKENEGNQNTTDFRNRDIVDDSFDRQFTDKETVNDEKKDTNLPSDAIDIDPEGLFDDTAFSDPYAKG